MRNSKKTRFRTVKMSLADMVGKDYADAACRACAFLTSQDMKPLKAVMGMKVEFFPASFQESLTSMLPQVGKQVVKPLKVSANGATTRKFTEASHLGMAPISGLGYYRVGEDGRLGLISKSEHYHAPLGHCFPGYELIELAKLFGIPNATHNNTRGHITRLLEEELVRAAAGLAASDGAGLGKLIDSGKPDVLNRVLNLETGSLVMEAVIKMMLARFYRVQSDYPEGESKGRIPVMVVMGDDDGTLKANYHGTTVIAQTLRGMWPELLTAFEKAGIMKVRPIRPNNMEDLESVFAEYNKGRHRIAGFFLELVMMNYGGRKLSQKFVKRAFALCKKHDVPTVVDEIQTCLWSPELFMFREYGIRPTFVAVGKGFPGGEYPAARVLFNSGMDNLPQFGALVTNGQEELASLAYLITMRWAAENGDVTQSVGEYYMERLQDLAKGHAGLIKTIEGDRHLAALFFHEMKPAKEFAKSLNAMGLDISVQQYKADCPPSALTKIPLIAGYEVVDVIIGKMEEALKQN